jgi:hypothetical protein
MAQEQDMKQTRKKHGAGLCHGNANEHALRAQTRQASCGCDCILPLRVGFVSEISRRGTGDEVALNIEIIVDGGMDAEKALGGSC